MSSVFTCLPDSSCSCLFEQDLVGWEGALCQGVGGWRIKRRRSQRERGHFFGVSQLRGEAGLPSSWPDSSIKECVWLEAWVGPCTEPLHEGEAMWSATRAEAVWPCPSAHTASSLCFLRWCCWQQVTVTSLCMSRWVWAGTDIVSVRCWQSFNLILNVTFFLFVNPCDDEYMIKYYLPHSPSCLVFALGIWSLCRILTVA